MALLDRAGRALLGAALYGVVVSVPAPALAQPAKAGAAGPKDKVALRLDQEGIGKLYLDAKFSKAEAKLKQAITVCGPKGCSPKALARIRRDLAVVYISGLSKVDAGKAELKLAVELDPDLELDPDFATPEMKQAWTQVRGKGGWGGSGPRIVQKALDHTVVGEQVVATPVPIFAKYSGSETARLRLTYKPAASTRWTSIPMELKIDGFAAEIPCKATAKEGQVAYYIEVLGDADEVVDQEGSRADPRIVNVKKELIGEAPHLPGAQPPARCENVCQGDACNEGEGEGEKKPDPTRKNWLSASVELDLAMVGSSTDTCTAANQATAAYSCFRDGGDQYLGNPVLGDRDNVNGGMAFSTVRFLIGYDRVLWNGLTAGVRLGFVVRGLGPHAEGGGVRSPLLFHGEARVAYWFGSDAFTTAIFRPFAFIAGGAAQVDAKFRLAVSEDRTMPPPPSQTNNPDTQSLDAYRRMGQGFFGLGAGFMVAFVPNIGIVLDAKYMRFFPTGGNALAPELGLAIGF